MDILIITLIFMVYGICVTIELYRADRDYRDLRAKHQHLENRHRVFTDRYVEEKKKLKLKSEESVMENEKLRYEIKRLKLELYKNISSYYKRNGENGREINSPYYERRD